MVNTLCLTSHIHHPCLLLCRLAFNFVVTFWLICGLLLLSLALTFVRDEQACQAAVKMSLIRNNEQLADTASAEAASESDTEMGSSSETGARDAAFGTFGVARSS